MPFLDDRAQSLRLLGKRRRRVGLDADRIACEQFLLGVFEFSLAAQRYQTCGNIICFHGLLSLGWISVPAGIFLTGGLKRRHLLHTVESLSHRQDGNRTTFAETAAALGADLQPAPMQSTPP